MSTESLASVPAAARRYCERRWSPIPVPRGEKAPTLRGWQRLRLTPTELARYFRDGEHNIRLLLGEPSGGLIDIDLDAPEAVAAAPAFLPMTGRRHGRSGKRTSHWWYVADPVPASAAWKDLDGTMLCELRSTGRQTIVPPSVHPSGEEFAWEEDGEPGRVSGQSLGKSVTLVAACALLARHWPTRGSRHAAALAAGGFLLRSGLDEATAGLLVETAARICHPSCRGAPG